MLPGCEHRSRSEDKVVKVSPTSDLVGTWKSEYSIFSVEADGTFKFTPLIEGNKSRGHGVWEKSVDGGFYIRYRADDANDYRFSGSEYFRLVEGEPKFFYIDSSETFKKTTPSEHGTPPNP